MKQEFKPHISEFKKSEVEEIKELINKYPVVGIVNLEDLPTLMLQRIKHRLKDDIILKITKKRLMKIAMDQIQDKEGIQQLKEKLEGIPALLFTKEDPFILYKKLEKSKVSAPAKPGQKAPNELKIEEGPTSFPLGPMMGELGMLGIKTEAKEGKIHVKNEKVLVKEGEEISEKVAGLLTKLGIEPMKVGLNLMLTYKDGEILEKSILAIDEEAYLNNLKQAHTEALALAMHLGIINQDTVKLMITKAQREATTLSDKAKLPTEKPKEEKKPEEKTPKPAKEPEKEVQEEPKEKTKEEPPTPKKEETQDIIPKIDQKGREVLHKIIGTPTEEKTEKEPEEPRKEDIDDDINKFINKLKDKKSRGEI